MSNKEGQRLFELENKYPKNTINNMNNFEKYYRSFPSINDNVQITVVGQNITISFQNSEERINILESIYNVLKLADGQTPIEEIYLSLSYKYDISPKRLVSFFEYAEKHGIVTVSKEGKLIPINYSNDIFPIKVSIILTDKCNLNCIYCYGDYSIKKNKFFPYEKIEPIFQDLKKNGAKAIELTGGEPLLHPDFLKICNLGIKYFNEITILSNGVLFSDEIIDFINMNLNIVSIQISIDGCTEETNNLIRKKANSWAKTLKSIERLSKIGAKLKVVYMLTYENKNEYLDACELMVNIGVHDFSISMPESIGRGADLKFPDQTPISNRETDYSRGFTDLALEADMKYGKILHNNVKTVNKKRHFFEEVTNCGTGWQTCAIDVDGDVIACQTIGKVSKLGNIFQNDIADVFHDNPIVKYLCNFKKSNIREECNVCSYKEYCGRCFMKILYANIDMINKGGEICPIGKENNLNEYFKHMDISLAKFRIL
jgi:radical SAM protein with 4Fe4S-binding SPASM domain